MFEKLRMGHPRLLALDEDFDRARANIEKYEGARRLRNRLHVAGTELLELPAAEHKLEGRGGLADRGLDGVWVLLPISRMVVDRIYTLATLYRLEGDERFARRAIEELRAVAAFPDWNPDHFLDTAEMTHAAALGYDWLHSLMDEADRTQLRAAIVEKGLLPGIQAFRDEHPFATRGTNWNQVCNGGLGMGALAIADEEPGYAEHILSRGLASLRRAMETYAPDGGWDEGPMYWHYGTRYLIYLMQSLKIALGDDFGLIDLPGFSCAGDYRIQYIGPLGRTFNYSDCEDSAGGTPEMFWLGRTFDKPEYFWHQRQWIDDDHIDHKNKPRNEGAIAQDLLWYEGGQEDPPDFPLDILFRKIEVAFFRSSWHDKDALFVGFKGGEGAVSHGHMDLGCFVLDALGKRWALELGMEEYEIRDFLLQTGQVKERWEIYRLGTESHNTLVIDNTYQHPNSRAPIVRYLSDRDKAFAIANLAEAYPTTRGVMRGVALLDRKAVLVQDEIALERKTDVTWGMLTDAEIELDGSTALLTLDDAHLQVRLLEPADGEFQVEGCNPPEPQKQQPHIRKLALNLNLETNATITVLLTPYRNGDPVPTDAPNLGPLTTW
jgi:hypothetical protein